MSDSSSIATTSTLLPFPLIPVLIVLIAILWAHKILYRSRLSHIPGPFYTRTSPLWLAYHDYRGTAPQAIRRLHERWGPVVLVTPDEVDISDGGAVRDIYGGKMEKPKSYSVFDIDGHPTIFSTLTMTDRATRAKSILPLFSSLSIRTSPDLPQIPAKLVARLRRDISQNSRVELSSVCRAYALDGLTAHLFGKIFGGLDEPAETLSIAGFVDSYVAAGGLSYVPKGALPFLKRYFGWREPEHVRRVFEKVEEFTQDLVDSDDSSGDTYHARLLDSEKAGMEKRKAQIECKDLMFAGVDSTGFSLATLLWRLAQHPEVYRRLVEECQNVGEAAPSDEVPYLTAVVKEGLRIGLANPTRLPRIVGLSGWTFGGFQFPPGSIVGCSGYELHLDGKVYEDPEQFRPERWMGEKAGGELARNWFAFGAGTRRCIAQNLAITELHDGLFAIAREDLLKSARGEITERVSGLQV